MHLALYINDNVTKSPEIIKKTFNNRLARDALHGARTPTGGQGQGAL